MNKSLDYVERSKILNKLSFSDWLDSSKVYSKNETETHNIIPEDLFDTFVSHLPSCTLQNSFFNFEPLKALC